MENTCKIVTIAISLHRVFHSIRFKVNKVGVQRYSFFVSIRKEKHTIHNIKPYKSERENLST